jgi:hypothetical protein
LRAIAIEIGRLCGVRRSGAILLANRTAAAEIHANPNEKPDLYAAAICIKVRSDHLVARLPPVCSVPAIRRTGRRREPSAPKVSFARLLLLFGGLFLRCLFRLLRFFGHVTLS